MSKPDQTSELFKSFHEKASELQGKLGSSFIEPAIRTAQLGLIDICSLIEKNDYLKNQIKQDLFNISINCLNSANQATSKRLSVILLDMAIGFFDGTESD